MSKKAQVLRLLNSCLITQTGNFACPERRAISGTVFLNSPSLRRMRTEGQSRGNETYLLSTACLSDRCHSQTRRLAPRASSHPRQELVKLCQIHKGRCLGHALAAVKTGLSRGPKAMPPWAQRTLSDERQGAALSGSSRLPVVMERLPLLLKLWSRDQQSQHGLGICCTFRLLDPTPDLLS